MRETAEMNASVTPNTKAQLLQNTVEHIDITSFDARPIIDSMRKMSFSSRDTARAADIFNMALEDKDCSPWLILAGSTSAGGCMHVWRDMIRNGRRRPMCHNSLCQSGLPVKHVRDVKLPSFLIFPFYAF